MMDAYRLEEPHVIPAFKKDKSVQLRIGKISERSEVGHTEIKIVRHIDDFEALHQEWNELAWESDTTIFQTYEWNRIWWKHFGRNKKLHIVAIYAEDKLIGVAPLFEDDVKLFGRKVYTSLRFLGSYVSQPEGDPLTGSIPYSDYLDFIIRTGYEKLFYNLILRYFEEVTVEFDEIIMDEVYEESAIQNVMIPLLVKSNYDLSYKAEQGSPSPIIQLDSSWKAYLKSLNVKDRYNARRYFKRSKPGKAKVFNIEKVKHAEDLPFVQSEFIRLHQQQWNNRGFAGTFSEQRMSEFFMDISDSLYEKDWIEFYMAVPAEGEIKIVAIDILITYKNRIYLLHRGMDEDPLYRKKGPGNVLLYSRLNEAISDGVKVFEMLRGSEEFKLRMATKINQNKKIVICSAQRTGRLLSEVVKNNLKLIHHVRTEKSHIKYVFKNKSLYKGITDYNQFMQRRIKNKLYN